jgi:hypothetical protein
MRQNGQIWYIILHYIIIQEYRVLTIEVDVIALF